MDRGVRKAGAAADKDRRRILVFDMTIQRGEDGKRLSPLLERKESGTNREHPCLVVCPGWV